MTFPPLYSGYAPRPSAFAARRVYSQLLTIAVR